jgi:hypothetical protein
VRGPFKAITIVAAYAVAVGGVLAALLLTITDDPWLAVLAAMAVVHLGFGWIVARWWTVLLPIVASIAGVLADVGGFSITTLLVGLPCAMLLLAGVALRTGWDDGGRAREVMPSFEEEVVAWDGRQAYLEDHPPAEAAWEDAEHAPSWGG